ncbi:MAG TPA: asparagine synthase (glutamine-hydrolyzing) [Candidatus Acidoferrales bacterium]|nr:asparagine synthase (glutamine-hydrolyzing) [Candidatus Acidoferrales bacterium]
MCGIYGFLTRGDVNRRILRAMGDVLSHRGPDDEGEVFLDEGGIGLALGHRRLSVIDLSPAARQPMANEDQTVWITYNGEIYNFQALRSELEQRGYRFRSHSDTEVILRLYESGGIDCLQKLNGMFAFALWDRRQKTLFLARDRIGEKPLHFGLIPDGIVFASEIKALLKHPQISRDIDLKSLSKYLTYEYVPAPNSIFTQIKKLEPGSYLAYRQGQIEVHAYWDIPLTDNPISYRTEQEYIEELRERFSRAVKARLVADVPVGVFLSGGIDSGLVAALAVREKPHLECFTIGFDEPSFDETAYARAVASALGAEQQVMTFTMREMAETLRKLPELLDEPLADASILPTYLLSKFTAERVKVALSGDGGDELFAGYPTYQAHRLVTYYDSLPGFVKTALRAAASYLPVSHKNISADFKVKQFLKGAGVSSEIRFFIWMGGFIDAEKRELLTGDVKAVLRAHNTYEDIFQYISTSKLTRDLERILYLSMKLYLQDDVLVKVDRASMANSLEVRCPFLDHELVEFVCHLPTVYKLNGIKTKYILKKAAEGMIPRAVITRPKKGFGIPLSRWLCTDLKELMLHYLSEDRIKKQGLFNFSYVRALIDSHLRKESDHRKLLWPLIVFQIWHERFIGSD